MPPVATRPIHSAFAEVWPEARFINLLDDGLTNNRACENELSASLIERFVRFGRYGYDMGADAPVLTAPHAAAERMRELVETGS